MKKGRMIYSGMLLGMCMLVAGIITPPVSQAGVEQQKQEREQLKKEVTSFLHLKMQW